MISRSCAKLSGPFKAAGNLLFNKTSFFNALLLVAIAGTLPPKSCPARESAVEEEYKAQRKFVQLQSSVDNEDYLKAQLILDSFNRDFSDTKFYKTHSKNIDEIAKKIKKKTKDINVEDKIEYLFVPPRLKTKLWQEYMSQAEMLISRRKGRMGVAVLRVIFENEDLENPSVRTDRNSANQLNIYSGCCGGYSCVGAPQSGGVVFVGSEFWRLGDSDLNKKGASATGDIIIGSVYHYPVKLKIEVQKGKAVAFGEVIVHSIPKEYCGNLMVKVEAEEGLELTNAAVNLRVTGFYPGITKPLENGSCLFSSIGPGYYNVELSRNDTFGSSAQPAEVVLGQTTTVTLNAYRHRMIELDWRFRKSNEPNNWLTGRRTMKTKEDWLPDGELKDVRYPVIEFGDWIDNTCNIRKVNGDLMYAETDEPFEKMSFPSNFSSSHRGYPIREGDVFAWRDEDDKQKGTFSEVLIRIRKISAVGISDDWKSSARKGIAICSWAKPQVNVKEAGIPGDQNSPVQEKESVPPSQPPDEPNSGIKEIGTPGDQNSSVQKNKPVVSGQLLGEPNGNIEDR
jgi:hypothetical protein